MPSPSHTSSSRRGRLAPASQSLYLNSLLTSLTVLTLSLPSEALAEESQHLSPAIIAEDSIPEIQPIEGLPLEGRADTDSGATEDPRLIGFWEYHGELGAITLEFQSETRMIFAGRALTYTVVPGAIRVKDEAGYVDYGYKIHDDTLCLVFSDDERQGIELTFVRVNLSPRKSAWRGAAH